MSFGKILATKFNTQGRSIIKKIFYNSTGLTGRSHTNVMTEKIRYFKAKFFFIASITCLPGAL